MTNEFSLFEQNASSAAILAFCRLISFCKKKQEHIIAPINDL